jgi:hypothetical protein
LNNDSTTLASDDLREDVMFRERAFWLYGTGHRFGDMRRLVRQYTRPHQVVFPIGYRSFPRLQSFLYSEWPNLALPQEEKQGNPLFRGCLNRDP